MLSCSIHFNKFAMFITIFESVKNEKHAYQNYVSQTLLKFDQSVRVLLFHRDCYSDLLSLFDLGIMLAYSLLF